MGLSTRSVLRSQFSLQISRITARLQTLNNTQLIQISAAVLYGTTVPVLVKKFPMFYLTRSKGGQHTTSLLARYSYGVSESTCFGLL
jgi:hypothetical protein